jgi:MFS family permease
VMYATLGLPIARWADRGNRRTIIALSVAVWSAATALCGVVQNFWQLALARVGVGVGEAGSTPPSQSLIADYFPPEKRASALSLMGASGTLGYLLGFAVGAAIAIQYGWRMLFLIAGLPGIVLALVAWLFIKEPRDKLGYPGATHAIEPLGQTLKALARKRSFVYLTIGITVYSLVAYGALLFVPSYLVRVMNQPLNAAGGIYGLLSSVGTLFGTVIGGLAADKLARRDLRWLAWLPAIACGLAGPLYIVSFVVPDMGVFMAAGLAAGLLLCCGLSPAFSVIHLVCGSSRRAVAVAIMLFCSNLIGMGLGPVITGAISDYFAPTYGPASLRWAIVSMCSLMAVVAWAFAKAASTMRGDFEA